MGEKKRDELQNSTSDNLSEDKFNSNEKMQHYIYIYIHFSLRYLSPCVHNISLQEERTCQA